MDSELAVILVEELVADSLELAARKYREELPADVERVLDAAVGVKALRDIFLLEFVRKLCIKLIHIRQRVLAQNNHEFLCVLTARIRGEQLVHRVRVVGSRLALADTLIFESGQGRQNVDRRIDALSVKLTAEDYLTLGDIAREVGNGMGLIVLGHGEDRNHRYAAGLALLPACAFIYRREVGVHISWISAAAETSRRASA